MYYSHYPKHSKKNTCFRWSILGYVFVFVLGFFNGTGVANLKKVDRDAYVLNTKLCTNGLIKDYKNIH